MMMTCIVHKPPKGRNVKIERRNIRESSLQSFDLRRNFRIESASVKH